MAPKSFGANQVYALTAYLLYLNDILPSDAALDEKSLPLVRMPNAEGFTQDHGLKSKLGKPDVNAHACMSNCAAQVKITSELPAHAKSAHGDLSGQMRIVGPYRSAASPGQPRK